MDALGIFWLVLYSIIGIVTFIKLRASSSTTRNQHSGYDDKTKSVNSITEVQKGSSSRVILSKNTSNRSCNSTDKKASNNNDENTFHHSKASIDGVGSHSQPKQNDTWWSNIDKGVGLVV